MSVFGVFKPLYGQIIPPEWYHGVADGLDFFYWYGVKYQEQHVEPRTDAKWDYGKPDKRFREAHFLRIYASENVYVAGRRVIKDYDPIQLYAFIDQAKQDIELIKHYLRFIAPGQKARSAIITVDTTPKPLFIDELSCRRIILRVPQDALYVIYIGDANSQDFPLFAGEKQELYVKNPKEVYVRATGSQKIFALFELAQ